jgi:hypothetical protein
MAEAASVVESRSNQLGDTGVGGVPVPLCFIVQVTISVRTSYVAIPYPSWSHRRLVVCVFKLWWFWIWNLSRSPFLHGDPTCAMNTNLRALVCPGIAISQTNATIGMSVISFFVLLWLLSSIFWWALFSSGVLVATHAVFRDASMHQDGEDKMDMVGEVGEDAAFLGSGSV